MNRKLPFLLLFISSFAIAQQPEKLQRPKVVIGIVVDQMRWDYLYRYYDRYGSNGFKRLISKGYNCDQTFINYLPTFTAPGHSCVYTGSVPSIHGIAGNNWVDNLTGREWYCTEDTTVQGTGCTGFVGKMSPRNLLTTTVTDELRLATNMQSRVFAIALKDRSSILPGGHLGNGVYWYDDATGNFITSTYYAASLPAWLNQFNARHLTDSFLKRNWNLLRPKYTYTQSIADSNGYEGHFSGETAGVFPHMLSQFAGKSYGVIRSTPYGNSLTLMLAQSCIKAERVGKGSFTDFLCISLSSTDYVGHLFSSNSLEAEDTYLRLDKDLAQFFAFLDQQYGACNYLLFLTADHGAAQNAAYLRNMNIPAGSPPESRIFKELNIYLAAKTGKDSLVKFLDNYQVYFDEKRINGPEEHKDIKDLTMDYFRKMDGVAYVVDLEEMDLQNITDPLKTMLINGYNKNRSGCIQVVPNPGWYNGYALTGTTHGTWNPYDSHIPLLWYGWHVTHGTSNTKCYMTDIAATVAAMLHIQMPNGCIGNVIPGVMK